MCNIYDFKLILSEYLNTAIEEQSLKIVGKDSRWNIERLCVKQIREDYPAWTDPSYLVDWLLDCDVHVVLCQGIHN